MEIPTKQDLDHIIDPIREIEERQIYEQIKPSDITAMVMEILTDNDIDMDMALEIIIGIHWNFQRHETAKIEKILEFGVFDREQILKLKEAKKKLSKKDTEEVLKYE